MTLKRINKMWIVDARQTHGTFISGTLAQCMSFIKINVNGEVIK